jgi:hypothetical protein
MLHNLIWRRSTIISIMLPTRTFQLLIKSCLLTALIIYGTSMASLVMAQSTIYGSMVGVVTDQSGAHMPGVTVTATNLSTNISTSALTDAQGNYRIENLIPGTYQVSAERASFKKYVRQGITLSTAQAIRIEITLEVGEVSETVNITQQTPLIETETPNISAVRSWEQRKYLPTVFPSFYTTLALDAGVVTANPGFYVSFAGSRTTQYNYSINGASFRSPLAGHMILGNYNEWQQEVKSSYVNNSAEYSALGNVDITTKSGGNAYHGSGVWYYTSGGLQGRSPFSPTRPSGVRNIFAGSIGGPIIKDRAFFFVAYSGARNHSTVNRVNTVPTELMRQGDFSELLPATSIIDPETGQPFPRNVIPTGRISQVSRAFIDRFYPLPNFPSPGPPADNYRVAVPQAPAEDNLLARIDYRFSDRHSLFGSYGYDEAGRGGFFTGSFPTVGFRQGYRRDQNVAISDVYAFSPTLSNEFNAGWSRDLNLIIGSTYGPDVAQLLGLQGIKPLPIPAIPVMNIAGFTTVSQQSYQKIPEEIYSLRDNVSWIRGQHRIKAGGGLTHGRAAQIPFGIDNFYGNFGFANGFATGYALADFLLGIPRTAFRQNADFFDSVYWQRNTWQAFIQDDFNMRRNLTLSIGLRYEYHEPFKDKNGRQYTFDPESGSIVVPNEKSLRLIHPQVRAAFPIVTASQAGYPERLVESDGNNFGPRIGLAYRPTDKMVVRTGYGIFYDFNPPLQGNISPFIPSESFPNNQIVGGVPNYQFPNPFPSTPTPVGLLTLAASARNVVIPYSQQWNLTVERQLFNDTAVRVSYIGTRGTKQVWFRELNVPAPSTTPFAQARRPYPKFASIGLQENGSGHLYQALQVQVEHRSRGGLYFRSHYTWAKDVGDNQGQREDSVLNPFNRRADKGDTFYLPRHRWISEFDWPLPVGKGKAFGANLPTALNHVVGGWRLSSIFIAGSGNFLTPGYSGYDAAGIGILGGRPDRIADGNLPSEQRSAILWFDPKAFTIPGASSATPLTAPSAPIGRFGTSGIGIIEGPGYWQYDLGLAKGFPVLGEKLRMNIFVLATNVLNHPNLTDPNMSISTPNLVGRISGIRGDANASGIGMRQVQLGLRVEF